MYGFPDPGTAPPRPPTQSSIPALLHTLQNEWDALVLETFVLKQQYNSTRQELSYALYAQDAATRVLARVIRERDDAREYVFSFFSVIHKRYYLHSTERSPTSKHQWALHPQGEAAQMLKCLTRSKRLAFRSL